MNIYLLRVKPDFNGGWDSFDAHVIQAKTPSRARKLCPYCDEGDIWTDTHKARIKSIGTTNRKTEQIILSSYRAGG